MGQLYHQLTDPNSATANYVRGRVNRRRRSNSAGASASSASSKRHRHETINTGSSSQSAGRGSGYNSTATGVLVTHPASKVPRWKTARLRKYHMDNAVWQTVYVSKSNRIPGSNNVLAKHRSPINVPECAGLLANFMLFQPFASAYSGTHTSYYRTVNTVSGSAGYLSTLYTPDTVDGKLDTVQRMADIQRQTLPPSVEATGAQEVLYENDVNSGAAIVSASQLAQKTIWFDQCARVCKLDLKFIATRNFSMKVSVSLVRRIKPTNITTLSPEDTYTLCNDLTMKGADRDRWVTEWNHTFVLKGLKKNKPIPFHLINKDIKMNVMQTNCFQDDTTFETATQAQHTILGRGLISPQQEVADGDTSGLYFIKIAYRRIRQPILYEYEQAVATHNGVTAATVSVPAVSETPLDIPTHANMFGGVPFETAYGNEGAGCFQLIGTMKHCWTYREDPEAIPSVKSSSPASNDYKKAQSLNLAPWLSGSQNGLYTKSPDDVFLAASTANTGP